MVDAGTAHPSTSQVPVCERVTVHKDEQTDTCNALSILDLLVETRNTNILLPWTAIYCV